MLLNHLQTQGMEAFDGQTLRRLPAVRRFKLTVFRCTGPGACSVLKGWHESKSMLQVVLYLKEESI